MVEENKTGKHIAKTIALPAILVISLLVARLVMHSKTGIRMAAPIELNRSGLSISMPSGNGWKCEEKWSFENNSFSVSSVFASGLSDRSYAQCRYILAAGKETPKERLGEEYSGTKLIVTGQSAADNLTVNWATINTDSGIEITLGVCDLADGRQLEIEVLQSADEQGQAMQIFDKIVKGIHFSDNGLLQAGVRLISDIRNKGLDVTMGDDSGKKPGSLFTISDARDKIIGFTMDAMAVVRTDAEANLNAADYYYLKSPVANEQVSFFRGSADLRQFTWRAETISRMGSTGIEMSADSGVLTVRRLRAGSSFNKQTGRGTGEYELGEAAVPNIVLEPILEGVLDSNGPSIIIDVIRTEGIITPVYIEKLPGANGQTDSNPIRMEWLDGRNYWEQTYYDNSKKRTKIVLEQESTYTLNQSDANEIIRNFPERANLVNGKKQLFDREGI